MTKSLSLSGFLVALIGINVYVFFFSHKTAPREVLNLQSTTKTMETNRREVLEADVRQAREEMAAPAANSTRHKALMADLGGGRCVEWSDSWSDDDLREATLASLERFEKHEREGH